MKRIYKILSLGSIAFFILQISSCVSHKQNVVIRQPSVVIPKPTSPPFDQLILGKWSIDSTLKQQDATISYQGIIQYFPNKFSNEEGTFTVSGTYEGKQLTLTYLIETSSGWLINNNELTETIYNVKSSIKSIGLDGITVDETRIPEEVINNIKKPEDFIIPGKTKTSKILSLTEFMLKLEEDNEVNTYYKH